MQEELLAWYAENARDLPWRGTRDPYRLLVSEVMLQQTQVARVVPAYERWLEHFPDERVLAAASIPEVLRAWSGLGYNRRALALRNSARAVVASGWPRDAAGLRALPGIGPYTAAAVASFAWDEPVAAVDVNVRRVIERRDGIVRGAAALARRADELLARERPASFNQAMMELGAMVCRPRAPRCGACPVAVGCAGPRPVVAPRRPGPRRRFEDTDRWARGQVIASLASGAPEPTLDRERRDRVLAGLERDGLVVRRGAGVVLPGGGGDDGEIG